MVFNTGAALLDAVVLAVVSKEKEGTYGYKITQDVRGVLDVSESTLYPVLRRLQKDDCLEVYDMAYAGRNRRYYKLTDRGAAQLEFYKAEWKIYASKISGMFEGGIGGWTGRGVCRSWRSCLLIFPRQGGRMPLIFIIVISMMQELRMKLRCSANLEVPRRLQRSSRRI